MKIKPALTFLLSALLLLGGCSIGAVTTPGTWPSTGPNGAQDETHSVQIFAMDTIMTMTAYGPNAQAALQEAEEYLYRLEKLVSVTDASSDLFALNHAAGQWVTVAPETLDLLTATLELSRQTEGTLDPTIYPVVLAWGFTTGTYQIPEQALLDNLLAHVDYTGIELDPDNSRVRLAQGQMLDFGSVAKGYAAQHIAQIFARHGIAHGLLDLGGNVQTIGTKPDTNLWRVGIQLPQPETQSYLGALAVADKAVVTSGGYQRFFVQDGTTYWHILDPRTGSPARSGLSSVTIVSDSGLLSDALSTTLFILGPDEGADFWRSRQDFDMILVQDSGDVLITPGLADSFSLTPDYRGTLEVIAP